MGKDTNNIEYDIIVIGSGLAAICTALEALEHDESLSVLLIDDATAAHGADAGKHAHHDEPLGAGDLDVLISKTTNAETRAWLKQHRDAFVPEISPCRRLSCMAWPFQKRETGAASEALLENAKTNPAGLLRQLEYRPACRALRLVNGFDNDGSQKLLGEKLDTDAAKIVTGSNVTFSRPSAWL
ncbi:hypothetical protein PG997_006343 [Apiospora hydei]|uniref:FAD dependent oxidoreductase domain-containing protein n=1 Tax=Apiospora hydei TaxID=1337664 RepID=A0ABR1WPW8_9PEZI